MPEGALRSAGESREQTSPHSGNAAPARSLRLLVVTSYYRPETAGTAPYATGMAEDLAARGHHVEVATTFPHYPAWRLDPDTGLLQRERLHGVTVRRRRLYVPRRQSATERALYEASMYVFGL